MPPSSRLILASLLVGLTGVTWAALAPSTREEPLPSWLAIRWTGRQRETVPPLILYVTDDDRNTATHAAGETETAARLTGDQFRTVARRIKAHPPPKPPAKHPAEFTLTLGTHNTTLSDTPLTTDGTRAFLTALKDPDLALPDEARKVAAKFAKASGL